MGQASLTVLYLRWRTVRNRDTAVRYLDALAVGLERRGWRCVPTYLPEVVPVRLPLLRVYGGEVAVTLCVRAMSGGAWGFHEAGRGEFLCYCGSDDAVVDRFLREWPRP